MGLDEVRDRAFHAADDAAVHHDRPVFRPVGADVVQVEALGLVEVDLDGGQGGLPARRIRDLHVDLRAVEGRLALGGLVGDAGAVQDFAEQGGGPAPQVRVGHVLAALAGEGEPVAGRADTQVGVGTADQLQRGTRLLHGLLQGAEDVRVVEGDGPHPGQTAEDTRQLRTVHAAQLGHAQRQFSVAVGAGAVDQGVVGTQAGAQQDLFRAQLHRREHVLAVVVPVPGDLVELAFAEDGRVHVPVAGPAFGLADVLLQGVPHDRPVGQPVAPISGSVSNSSSSRPSRRWSCTVVMVAPVDRERAPRDEAPGHSPRGFGHLRQLSARRDTLRRRRTRRERLGALHGRDRNRGAARGARGFRGGTRRAPNSPSHWCAVRRGGAVRAHTRSWSARSHPGPPSQEAPPCPVLRPPPVPSSPQRCP